MNRLLCWFKGHAWKLVVIDNYKSEIEVWCTRCGTNITAKQGAFHPLRHDLIGTRWDK